MSDKQDDEKMDQDPVTSSDSENDDDVEEQKRYERIKELSNILAQNPYDYQTHVDRIGLLSQAGELDQLREAREKFASLYPLTPKLWLSWISDEQRMATSPEEKRQVANLLNRAVKDYLSVDLWLEYCQFSLNGIGTPEGVKEARSVFERAVVAAGVHVANGTFIWEAYREFENALLTMQPGNEEQMDRVDKVFRRQLAVPLANMEATFGEYQEWLKENKRLPMDKNVERNFKTCLNMLTPRLELEDKLDNIKSGDADPQKDLMARVIYREYLELELKEANPVRVQSIFERRATDHCLNPDLWVEYVDYLESKLKVPEVSLAVFERAVQNCPWSVTLWIKFLRALERHKCEKTKVVAIMEQALAGGLSFPTDYRDLWLAYIDYERRQMILDEEPFRDQSL